MEEREMTLEEAAKALAVTAERAGRLMKQEAQRVREESDKLMAQFKEEARRARQEAEQARGEADALRGEFEAIRAEMRIQIEALQGAAMERSADSERSRRHASRAWGAVGVMGFFVLVGAAWTASSLTRSDAQSAYLDRQLGDARLSSAKKDTQIITLRGEVETAKVAQARLEGELHAFTAIKGDARVLASAEKPAAQAVEAPAAALDDEAFLEFELGVEPLAGAALVKDEPEAAKAAPATQPVQAPTTQPVVTLETETVGSAKERSTFSKLMDRILSPVARR